MRLHFIADCYYPTTNNNSTLSQGRASFLGGGAVEDYNLSYRQRISTNDDRRVWGTWQFWHCLVIVDGKTILVYY